MSATIAGTLHDAKIYGCLVFGGRSADRVEVAVVD
jgi:hypothetical protein